MKFYAILLITLSLSAYAADKAKQWDTGFLQTQAPKVKAPEGTKPQPKGSNQSKYAYIEDQKNQAESLANATETVNSLTLLLRNVEKGPRRNQLLLNHAAALNLFARLKILATKDKNLAEETKKYFRISINDANEVLASPDKTQQQVMLAHNVIGTSYLYLDLYAQARSEFLQVLKLNPPADKAGRIGLMVAEDYFDEGKFQEAAHYYTYYYAKMPPEWKALAMYKLGWCMMNLNEPDKAESYFVRIAGSQDKSGVGKDAMRDLAYLVTHRSEPLVSVERVEAKLKNLVDRLDFLHNVRANFEGQGEIQAHSRIVTRILKDEKDTKKRLEVLLADFRVQRRMYASRDYYNAFVASAQFTAYDTEYEQEMQMLMKAFIDTYAGRVKSPEPWTTEQLQAALKNQFQFYHRYFSQRPNYPQVISIWGDICVERKDWACVDQVSQIVLDNPKVLGKFTERAYLDQIAALSEIKAIDPKVDDKVIHRRDLRAKEFVERFPESNQWLRVAKLHAQTEVDQGHEKSAIGVLDAIVKREATPENYERLQYARFKANEHEVLLDDPRNKNFSTEGSKTSELIRESSLVMAQRAKEAKDVDHYRTFIHRFVALSTDPAKIRIARSDYFNFLLQNERIPEAINEFFSLPEKDIKHPELDFLRSEMWKAAIDLGKFEAADKLAQLSSGPDWNQRAMLSSVFLGEVPDEADLKSYSPAIREYLLGMMVLLEPDMTLRYLKQIKRGLNEGERDLAALAYRIKSGQWQLVRSPELEMMLGRNFPFVEREDPKLLPVEKKMNAIRFIDLKRVAVAKQGRVVGEVIGAVRSSREMIAKSIQGRAPGNQLRVLVKAAQIEKQTAEYLVNSPIPNGLAPEQVTEYQNGLKAAAEEFTKQSGEFEVLAKAVSDQMQKSTEWIGTRLLPQPNLKEWPWPEELQQDPQLSRVSMLIRAKNDLGALALLNYFREKHVKKDEDFYAIRAGILLGNLNSAALRVYLLEELQKEKQKDLIEKWAKLVNRPVPEVKE